MNQSKCQLGHAFNVLRAHKKFRLLLTCMYFNNFSAWKDQGNQNVLAKYTMDAFGWEYDPTNPLGKAVEGLGTI